MVQPTAANIYGYHPVSRCGPCLHTALRHCSCIPLAPLRPRSCQSAEQTSMHDPRIHRCGTLHGGIWQSHRFDQRHKQHTTICSLIVLDRGLANLCLRNVVTPPSKSDPRMPTGEASSLSRRLTKMDRKDLRHQRYVVLPHPRFWIRNCSLR